MKARNVTAALWNLLPLPFDAMEAEIVDAPAPAGPGGVPLNKICDRSDWEDPAWRAVNAGLGYSADPANLHRKEWEFTQGVYGMRRLRCLAPEAAALGLGCGHEPIVYFLARRLARVVATDLYEGEFSGQEANPRMLAHPELFAPFAYPLERLEVRRMDATRIEFPDETFDLVFSFSALEHFGSRREQARSLAEVRRVLRPGGVAAITTEIVLNRHGRHGEYFRRAELLERLVPESGLRLGDGPFSFATSRETFEGLVRIPAEKHRRPHLILKRWNTIFTSCALFLEKPVPPGTPGERLARRGEERPVDFPPLLAAAIAIEAAPAKAAPGETFEIRCRITNTGVARWQRAAPGVVAAIRLGAHLLSPAGSLLQRDYGRADFPADVAPGASAEVTIRLAAPGSPGEYRVELDPVREGVTWFSEHEVRSAASVPLLVR